MFDNPKGVASALALCLLLAFTAARAADIDITFYFSKKDPHLPETEKALADAVKQIPQLRITRISIDDPEGYKQFAADEKMREIKDPGEMMVVFGPYALTSKGERRHIEQCLVGTMQRAIAQMEGKNDFKQRLPVDAAPFISSVFGAEAKAEKVPAKAGASIVYHRITRGGKPAGWVADAYHVITCPICSDAQFLLATDEKLNILAVRPVRELERFGAKLPEAETAQFTAQFKGKAAPLVKVEGISGATKTSHAYQAAIAEILEELKKQ